MKKVSLCILVSALTILESSIARADSAETTGAGSAAGSTCQFFYSEPSPFNVDFVPRPIVAKGKRLILDPGVDPSAGGYTCSGDCPDVDQSCVVTSSSASQNGQSVVIWECECAICLASGTSAQDPDPEPVQPGGAVQSDEEL